MYVFKSEFKALVKRVEAIEALFTPEQLKEARILLAEIDQEECVKGHHEWRTISAYEKHGEAICVRCNKKNSW